MKATINGITVEGTPEEIAEYRRLTEIGLSGPIKPIPPMGKLPEWLTAKPVGYIKATTVASKCPNYGTQCFCTGECMK